MWFSVQIRENATGVTIVNCKPLEESAFVHENTFNEFQCCSELPCGKSSVFHRHFFFVYSGTGCIAEQLVFYTSIPFN